jgi:hypothetical protein
MRLIRFVLVSSLSAVPLACGAAEPSQPVAVPEPDVVEPSSAEWIFVTDGVRGGRRGECQAVTQWISGEESCKGNLCSHGAALAKDWLKSCKKLAPALAGDVEKRAEELEKKAKQMSVPCEDRIRGILDNGCGDKKDCGTFVQGWATSCADWSTPLVIRMLEVTVQRDIGERFEIDSRSCKQLLGELTKAATCDQQFKCQDLFPVIEDYKGHCQANGKLPSLAAAIAQLSVRVGATESPEPLPVDPAGDPLDPAVTPLPLADGSGAVLMVCGKRAGNISGYLAARKQCSEDVVFARRFEDNGAAVVRVGRIAHPSDNEFHERYFSLEADGEIQARFDAMLPGFVATLKQVESLASDPKHSTEAIRLFVRAINDNLDAARDSKVFDTAFREHDAALVPLFVEIGKQKRAVVHNELAGRKFAAGVRRAELYPLSDMDADGRGKLGAWSLASGVDIVDMLPKSIAAYREELEPRYKRLEKLKLTQRDIDALSMQADGHSARCGQAAKGYVTTEQALIDCHFGVKKCEADEISNLEKQLDRTKSDEESAYTQTALAITSLPVENRDNAWTAAKVAGCKEPWW